MIRDHVPTSQIQADRPRIHYDGRRRCYVASVCCVEALGACPSSALATMLLMLLAEHTRKRLRTDDVEAKAN